MSLPRPAYLDPRYTSIPVRPSEVPIKPLDPLLPRWKWRRISVLAISLPSLLGWLCAQLRIPLPSKLWTSTAPNGDTMHKFQTFANFSHLNGNSIQPTNCQIIFAVSLQIKDKNVWQFYTVDSSGQWSHRLIYRRNRVGHKWKYDTRYKTWWQLMWNRCSETLGGNVIVSKKYHNSI